MTATAPPGSPVTREVSAPSGTSPADPARSGSLIRRLVFNVQVGVAAFFTVLALVFLWPVTVGGKALLPTDALYVTPPWSAFADQNGVDQPHNPLIADQILQNYSWKSFARAELWAGRLPLWNPHVFTGMPFLAAGQYAVLYPPGVLFYVLPLTAAYGWFTALHLVMGALFMYYLLRVLGAGRLGAGLSGTGFMFMGFLVVSFLWPMVVSAAVWLPLLLACTEQVVRAFAQDRNPELRRDHALLWGLAGAAALALHLLAGHLEISVYVLSTVGFYAAARLLFVARDRGIGTAFVGAAALSGMVALGFVLAAVQLLPFTELIRENYRAGQVTYDEVVGWALPKKHILAFLMPDIFGNPSHHSYLNLLNGQVETVQGAADLAGEPRNYAFWGVKNYVEGMAYVGVLPLVLGMAAVVLRPSRSVVIFAVGSVVALLLAFGSPLYGVLFYGVPGFQQIHSPFRWVFPWGVAVLVLAGLGLDVLVGSRNQEPGRSSWPGRAIRVGSVTTVVAGLVCLAGAVLAVASPGPSLARATDFLAGNELARAAFASPEMFLSYEVRVAASFGLLLLASGGLLVWAVFGRGRRWAGGAAIALLAVDLYITGAGFNAATDPKLVEFLPPSLQLLQEDPTPFRVVAVGDGGVLRPNSGMLAGLEDVRGYDTIIPKQYVEFWRQIEEPSGLLYSQINRFEHPESLASPLVSLMNVKYALSAAPINVTGWTEIYRGEVFVYRNDGVQPRAFAVFDTTEAGSLPSALEAVGARGFDPRRSAVVGPLTMTGGAGQPIAATNTAVPTSVVAGASNGDVEIVGYQPGRVTVRAAMPRDGLLVLTDQYFPGWRAKVDETEVPVLRANAIFRGVQLPTGEHTVTFWYVPDSFRLGTLFSLMGGVVFVAGSATLAGRRIFRAQGDSNMALRVVKNSVSPMAAQLLGRAIDFGFAVFMLRTLGPAEAGNYAFAVALIGYFGILSDYGLGILLTREVARAPHLTGRYLVTITALRLALCVTSMPLLFAVLWGYSTMFGLAETAVIASLLFLAGLFPSAVSGTISSVFSAFERMEVPAAVTIFTTIVRATIGVVLLVLGWGVVGLGITSVAAATLTMLVFIVLGIRAFGWPSLSLDRTFSREVMGTSTPLMLNQLLNTLFFRVDVMLLQPMTGAAAVGQYTTAYKFVDALNIIPSWFTLALFPVMSRYAVESKEALLRLHVRAMKALMLVALPVSLGTTFVAPQVIVDVFGPAYAPAGPALQVLIWYLPFSYLNSITHYVLIAVGQQRFLTFAFFIGTTFNVTANLLLIPHFGLMAAAVVTVLSEIVLLLPFWWGIHRQIGHVPLSPLIVRPGLATLAMGAALYPIRDMNFLMLGLIGTAVYVVALFAFGTFDAEDRRLLRTLRARGRPE